MSSRAERAAGTRGLARAPATIANLGPGFDCMGLALREPADVVEARWGQGEEVVLEEISGVGARDLPRDPERNCAAVAAREALRLAGVRRGVRLRLRKGLPPGSGMGSSSASSAAGAVAVHRLIGARLSDSDLLRAALCGERVASGAEHPDNVAPALFGGLVLVRSIAPLDLVRVQVPPRAWFALVRPHRVVRTEQARRVLPRRVPMEAAVENCRNAAALLLAAERGDLALWGRATRDRLAEPARRALLFGLEEARAAALEAGALGHGISGSGPAQFALCRGRGAARAVATAMARVYRRRGVGCDTLVTRADNCGAAGRAGRRDA
jgi:homoserine kinase